MAANTNVLALCQTNFIQYTKCLLGRVVKLSAPPGRHCFLKKMRHYSQDKNLRSFVSLSDSTSLRNVDMFLRCSFLNQLQDALCPLRDIFARSSAAKPDKLLSPLWIEIDAGRQRHGELFQ